VRERVVIMREALVLLRFVWLQAKKDKRGALGLKNSLEICVVFIRASQIFLIL
jgi:hypothetical protein